MSAAASQSNPYNFFAFVPQLKPFQIIPSEENPKEFILIVDESGASLGITYTERRLIESLDGRLAVGDIVLQTADDSNTNLSDIRKLLWDVDRFGFLENSPWNQNLHAEGWGYWGVSAKPIKTFYYSWTLPFFDHWTAQIWIFLLTILFFMFNGEGNLLGQVRVGVVNDSLAFGMLTVLFGILSASLISIWDAARVLCTVHDSPVQIQVFWKSPFLYMRLDGRRLRMLPVLKSVYVCSRPVLMILLAASICVCTAQFSGGVRQEWLFHLSVGMIITAIWQGIPWVSTLFSRDIKLRLRGDSLFWIAWRGMRKAFQSLFQSSPETEANGTLFLWWGVWAILSSVLLLRVLALIFRSDFPVLLSHFIEEDNALVLWIFIVITFVIFFSIAAALMTLLVRLLRDGYSEIKRKLFPHHLQRIAWWVPVCSLFLGMLCIFSGYSQSPLFLNVLRIVLGLSTLALGAYFIQKEWKGLYKYLHISTLCAGLIILLPLIGDNVFSIQIICLALFGTLFIAMTYGTVYMSSYTDPNPAKDVKVVLAVIPVMILFILHFSFSRAGSEWIVFGGDVRYILFVLEVVLLFSIFKMYQTVLNLHAFVFISLGLYIVTTYTQTILPELNLLSLLFLCSMAAQAYLLKAGIETKTANRQSEIDFHTDRSDIHKIADVWFDGFASLFERSISKWKKNVSSEEDLRNLLFKQDGMIGSALMHALFRRTAAALTWRETQTLASLLPPAVQIPKITKWDEEKVMSYLRNVPTFMQVGAEIKEIANITRIQFFEAGDRMIAQHETGNELFIIVQGKASIESEHAFGQTRLAMMTTGDFVGEIGFLSGTERTASVWALEPVTALVVNRKDISDSLPGTKSRIHEAETGQSWLQRLHQFPVFREFPPGLLSRVCLESQHVHLEVSRTVVMHKDKDAFINSVAVLLSGEVVLQQEEVDTHFHTGQIAGLPECILQQQVQGVLRANCPSHVLMVSRHLLHDALAELLTPKQILQEYE